MLGGANNSFEIYDNTVVNLSPFIKQAYMALRTQTIPKLMLTYTKRAADNMSPNFSKTFMHMLISGAGGSYANAGVNGRTVMRLNNGEGWHLSRYERMS